jgi:phosphoribosylglycinamide formyltransferase-1
MRTAVLISGRGSNLAALVDAAKARDYPATIDLVVSDNPLAAGLARAREHGMACAVVERARFGSRAEFEAALMSLLCEHQIELICLAGFMRILSADFIDPWSDRILNIHPSLLPALPGLDTHKRALDAGLTTHGATVHFVRAEVDNGPIIIQEAVPVLPRDTADTLAARVLAAEHRIYPAALKLVASGRAKPAGERVLVDGMVVSPLAVAQLV